MQIREQGETPEAIETRGADIAATLKGVPDKLRDIWLARADVAAALGFVWGETGHWANAVEWLDKALHAETGDCPVRAVEQCANFRVRLSGERWALLRATPDGANKEAERQDLIVQIEQALRELDRVNLRARTPERLSLRGSAYKRLAWLQSGKKLRLKALVNMANSYLQAHELILKHAKERNEQPGAYGFTNWATAKVLCEFYDPEQDKAWRKTLEDDCQQMIEDAHARNQNNPNYWDSVAEADCELLLLLAQGVVAAEGVELAKAAKAAADRIAKRYRAAAKRGASPREYASVLEHLDFVIALSGISSDGDLTEALAALRGAL